MKVKDFIDRLMEFPLDWDVVLIPNLIYLPEDPGMIMTIDLYGQEAFSYNESPPPLSDNDGFKQIGLRAVAPK